MRGLLAFAALTGAISAGPAFAQTAGPSAPDRAPSARTMTGGALAAIISTITRQLQPCADRQIIPSPEAGRIAAVVRIELNRDGSLAKLEILDHQGIDDANVRFIPRVDLAVKAIFSGCTPFQGLPPELYDVPRGWRQMTFRYRLGN